MPGEILIMNFKALTYIQLPCSAGHTHQVQLLDGDHAEWLSLCLLCLNHLADTTVFFSFTDLNLSHLATKYQTSINAEIPACLLATVAYKHASQFSITNVHLTLSNILKLFSLHSLSVLSTLTFPFKLFSFFPSSTA